MGSLSIRDLGPGHGWGARVSGVGTSNIHDADLRKRLADLLVERGLIIFEDMEPSPTLQVELSKVFGPLKDHPTKSTARADTDLDPGIIAIDYKPMQMEGTDHGLAGVNGKKLISFLPWHFDHTYNDELNYAGVLRPLQIAPEMGRTGFADGMEIYKRLDPELIARIQDKNVLYTLDVRLTQMHFGRYFETYGDLPSQAGNLAEAATFPRAIHPMVWTRPTGEKVAHFCGFGAEGIEGHEDPEGEALFEEALQEMYKVITPFWHEWRLTDMVIWDNARVLHSVEGCDPKYPRTVHRTTIRGDYGLGRFEGGKKIGEVQRDMPPLALPDGVE
ncbi:MAG: TauD/TfdA family dioxygenase [Sphingomonadaceae bacterium]|nr:TauD/TfdA family dioxygenase [Sphingomonadaceae bacterium]